MCGIAGIMTRKGTVPDPALIESFKRDLRHRGPDSEGTHISGTVAMVQTRLAIIDLETGDQPLFEPGGAALVANGEIYNYLELREELCDVGARLLGDDLAERVDHVDVPQLVVATDVVGSPDAPLLDDGPNRFIVSITFC